MTEKTELKRKIEEKERGGKREGGKEKFLEITEQHNNNKMRQKDRKKKNRREG